MWPACGGKLLGDDTSSWDARSIYRMPRKSWHRDRVSRWESWFGSPVLESTTGESE